MKGLTEPMLEMESYRQILEGIEQGRTPVFATGVIDAAKSHLLLCLREHIHRPLLVLTYSELRAREILEDMAFLQKDCAY